MNTLNEKKMIKNFIYLDEEKMYSLSSQLFEGVTEYVLKESVSQQEDSEQQKGPVGSGKILGDILKRSDRHSEKKFLNDYSYTIFEKKLIDDDRVVIALKLNDVESTCNEKKFIKATSKIIFNDIKSIKSTLEDFNKIGKAIAHVTNHENITAVKSQLEKAKANIKDRNQKRRMESELRSITNINKLAKDSGLQQDQDFLDDLALVLSYGFQDQLEVQMDIENIIISANLNRSFLREKEELVIRKYSRRTEVNFTLFGIITQFQGGLQDVQKEKKDIGNMKEALMNLVFALSNVEEKFIGRLSNEIIVDPIALYTEL